MRKFKILSIFAVPMGSFQSSGQDRATNNNMYTASCLDQGETDDPKRSKGTELKVACCYDSKGISDSSGCTSTGAHAINGLDLPCSDKGSETCAV